MNATGFHQHCHVVGTGKRRRRRYPVGTMSPNDTDSGRVPTPIPHTEEERRAIRFGPDGLVPAVVQDAGDGTVLMLGYMDAEALHRTLDTGRTWFWSRSRQEYWCKGETSGDRQWVRDVRYDCDGDAVLVVVDQDGKGACHTGARSCFYRSFGSPPP